MLGAKAGQKRYQQIKTQADRVWGSDPVQARVETVKQTVKDQAPVVAAKLGDAAKTAGASAKERLTGQDVPERCTTDRHSSRAAPPERPARRGRNEAARHTSLYAVPLLLLDSTAAPRRSGLARAGNP